MILKKSSNSQSESSGLYIKGKSIMERSDFFRTIVITFAYLGFVGLVF
jgi:hypothetical protein